MGRVIGEALPSLVRRVRLEGAFRIKQLLEKNRSMTLEEPMASLEGQMTTVEAKRTSTPQPSTEDSVEALQRELAQARLAAKRSQDDYNLLRQGVRLLAQHMKQADRQDDPEGAEDSVRSRLNSTDSTSLDPRFEQVTTQLAPGGASDLMALQNAASMLQEHAYLASAEANVSVEDTVQAQAAEQEWRRRALRAESKCLQYRKERKVLRSAVEKMSSERKVLIKEVRALRQHVSTQKKDSMWMQLEQYVAGALSFHENQLRSSSSSDLVDTICSPKDTFDESSVVEKNRAETPSGEEKKVDDDRATSNAIYPAGSYDSADQSAVKLLRAQSPMTIQSTCGSEMSSKPNDDPIPKSVATDGSMLTPLGSPAYLIDPNNFVELKNDPKVFRSLAMPIVEDSTEQ